MHKNYVKKLVDYLTLDFFNVVAIPDLLVYNNFKWQIVRKSGVKSLNVENSVETVENQQFLIVFNKVNGCIAFSEL